MNKLLLKKNKFDKFLLMNHNKIFVLLGFIIFSMALLYVYFLFMSVSYTYAQNKNLLIYNNLVVENSELTNSIIKNNSEKYDKIIASNFVNINNIEYIKKDNKVIVKLSK